MKLPHHLTIAACVVTIFHLSTQPSGQAASVIQFSAITYNVTEGTPEVAILVQRTNDLGTVVSVDFATTTNGSATAGADYMEVSTTLTFLANETNKTVTVPIPNDGLVESLETFQVMLTNTSAGAILGVLTTATVQIRDNDTGLQIEVGSYSVKEDAGSVLIGVLRGDDGNFPVTVDYATTNGTALAGQDYTETKGTLAFAAGEKVKLFTVPILNDALKEPVKNFRVTLSNPTGGGVFGSRKTATITIADNDPGVQLEYNQYWVQENEGTLTVTVLRGNDVELPVFTVDFATTNLTALAGQDYTETKGTLTFAAGESEKTITVPIAYDELPEADEKFKLTLSNPSGGVVLGPTTTATITILDTTGTVAHRFDGIAVLPDQSVRLTLGGGVHKRFKDYFDLYPIEVSTNLLDWTPLTTLQRTNSNTNAFTYTDTEAGASGMRFYRTVATNFITPFKQPTGPLPVCMVYRWLNDTARRNRYGISTNGSFGVSIWYPAAPESGKSPVAFEDSVLWHEPEWVGDFFDRTPHLVSHALAGAQCATTGGPFPIVLYSHGWQGSRHECVEKAVNLASHGYVVASMDHFDAFMTASPAGTLLRGDITDASHTAAGCQDRLMDLRFVLDELVRWNDVDPTFGGHLDLTKVAVMGASWGGDTVAEFGRTDERVKALVLLDAYPERWPQYGGAEVARLGLSKPFVGMYSTELGGETGIFNKATRDAVWLQISSTEHLNFFDYYWAYYADNLEAAREAARSINAYTLWFLNKYLQGSSEPLPPLSDYPRVINLKQK